MTDKERILMNIVRELKSSILLSGAGPILKRPSYDGEVRAHFHNDFLSAPAVGDLVICDSGRTSDFAIAWVHQVISRDECILREIGSHLLCHWRNESFTVIRGIPKSLLYEGEQYAFMVKVERAMSYSGERFHLYAGVEFPEDWVAKIWVRRRWAEKGDLPYSVEMPYTKRTSQKAILQALKAAGYGTREFGKEK